MYRSLMALIEGVSSAPPALQQANLLSEHVEPPVALIRAVEEGACFLFAGEELSRSSGVPSWSQYLSGLIDYLARYRIVGPTEAIRLCDVYKSGRYGRVAQLIRAVDQGNMHARQYACQLYSGPVPLSRTHRALSRIPFCAAVTPNLDSLVEQITTREAFCPVDFLKMEDRLAESLPFVLKLRSFAANSATTVWPDEARDFLQDQRGEALRELFGVRTMLAIGVSLDDLHRWLRAAGVTAGERLHFAVVDSSEAEQLKQTIETLWRRFRVHSIVGPRGGCAELLSFLRRLTPHETPQ